MIKIAAFMFCMLYIYILKKFNKLYKYMWRKNCSTTFYCYSISHLTILPLVSFLPISSFRSVAAWQDKTTYNLNPRINKGRPDRDSKKFR